MIARINMSLTEAGGEPSDARGVFSFITPGKGFSRRSLKKYSITGLVIILSFLIYFPASADDESLGWPDRLRVVYLPSDGKEATLAHFAPLNDYLSRMLGLSIEPISFDTYSETIAYLGTRKFDLAYLSPSTYSQALPWLPLQVAALELGTDGRRGYRSLIVCAPGAEGASLNDFTDKVFAFASPESASGFIVPLRYFISDLAMTPGMFARRVLFAGNHKRVIEGVLAGTYDLGATNDMDLERIGKTLPEATRLRVLWQSELIPGAPFCTRPGLPDSLSAAVQVTLWHYKLDPERVRLIASGGFVPATDDDYLSARSLESYRP